MLHARSRRSERWSSAAVASAPSRSRRSRSRLRDEDFKASLANERTRHEEEMRRDRERMELHEAQLSRSREAEQKKYEALNALGVDLTQYLVSLAAARPDNHLKIDSNTAPTVHLELPSMQRGGREM